MTVQSFFECFFCKPDVFLCFLSRFYRCFVHYAFFQATFVNRAGIVFPAVTCFSSYPVVNKSAVVTLDSVVYIRHAAAGYLQGSWKTCNCRKNDTCPVDERCLEEGIVYEATVKSGQETKKYVGLTEGTFKKRLYDHRQSFKNNSLKNAAELSKHIWHLKEKNEEYEFFSDTPDDCNVPRTCMKRCVEWISV